MGNYNFKKDLAISHKSVEMVMELLKEKGATNLTPNDDTKWDIGYLDVSGTFKSAEVKEDMQWEKTGNVAIEFISRGKPSGIATSKADNWFYVLGKNAYVAPTGAIRAFLIQHWDRFRRVKGGDDGTSQLALLKIDDFLDIFSSI